MGMRNKGLGARRIVGTGVGILIVHGGFVGWFLGWNCEPAWRIGTLQGDQAHALCICYYKVQSGRRIHPVRVSGKLPSHSHSAFISKEKALITSPAYRVYATANLNSPYLLPTSQQVSYPRLHLLHPVTMPVLVSILNAM